MSNRCFHQITKGIRLFLSFSMLLNFETAILSADEAPLGSLLPKAGSTPAVSAATDKLQSTPSATAANSQAITFTNAGALSMASDSTAAGAPHEHDPEPVHLEHEAAINLVAMETMDVRSSSHCTPQNPCNFSDANTWETKGSDNIWRRGQVPASGAHILIAEGSAVRVDAVISTAFETMRVDGQLFYDTKVNTELKLTTMVVTSKGKLTIGDTANPVSSSVTSKLTFNNRSFSEAEKATDLFLLGHGLIVHGGLSINGAEVESTLNLAFPYEKGKKEFTVVGGFPKGWKIGDFLVIGGGYATERLRVAGISPALGGNTIIHVKGVDNLGVEIPTWTGLRYNGTVPNGDDPLANVHGIVSNLSRNVQISTAGASAFGEFPSSEPSTKAHFMLMHAASAGATISNASYLGLGRTNSNLPPDDTRVVNGLFVQGKNPVGRYAFHAHRTGTGAAIKVKGVVISGSDGHGFVNHSSNVNADRVVVYGVKGNAYHLEEGTELGSLTGCVGYKPGQYATGSLDPDIFAEGFRTDGGIPIEALGFSGGYGLWMQGASASNVLVENFVSVGSRAAGIAIDARALHQKGFPLPTLPGGRPMEESVLRGIISATVLASAGVDFLLSNSTPPSGQNSIFKNLRLMGGGGFSAVNSTNFELKNSFIGGGDGPNFAIPSGTIGIQSDATTAGRDLRGNQGEIVYSGLTVHGFSVGVDVPLQGKLTIDNCSFQNLVDVWIQAPSQDRSISMVDNKYLPLSATQRGSVVEKIDIKLSKKTLASSKDFDLYDFYKLIPDVIISGDKTSGLKRIYYIEQAASYIPFPSPDKRIPGEFLGKTNQQLFDLYRISPGGVLAPGSVVSRSGITGLLGSATPLISTTSPSYATALHALLRSMGVKYFERSASSFATVAQLPPDAVLAPGAPGNSVFVAIRRSGALADVVVYIKNPSPVSGYQVHPVAQNVSSSFDYANSDGRTLVIMKPASRNFMIYDVLTPARFIEGDFSQSSPALATFSDDGKYLTIGEKTFNIEKRINEKYASQGSSLVLRSEIEDIQIREVSRYVIPTNTGTGSPYGSGGSVVKIGGTLPRPIGGYPKDPIDRGSAVGVEVVAGTLTLESPTSLLWCDRQKYRRWEGVGVVSTYYVDGPTPVPVRIPIGPDQVFSQILVLDNGTVIGVNVFNAVPKIVYLKGPNMEIILPEVPPRPTEVFLVATSGSPRGFNIFFRADGKTNLIQGLSRPKSSSNGGIAVTPIISPIQTVQPVQTTVQSIQPSHPSGAGSSVLLSGYAPELKKFATIEAAIAGTALSSRNYDVQAITASVFPSGQASGLDIHVIVNPTVGAFTGGSIGAIVVSPYQCSNATGACFLASPTTKIILFSPEKTNVKIMEVPWLVDPKNPIVGLAFDEKILINYQGNGIFAYDPHGGWAVTKVSRVVQNPSKTFPGGWPYRIAPRSVTFTGDKMAIFLPGLGNDSADVTINYQITPSGEAVLKSRVQARTTDPAWPYYQTESYENGRLVSLEVFYHRRDTENFYYPGYNDYRGYRDLRHYEKTTFFVNHPDGITALKEVYEATHEKPDVTVYKEVVTRYTDGHEIRDKIRYDNAGKLISHYKFWVDPWGKILWEKRVDSPGKKK